MSGKSNVSHTKGREGKTIEEIYQKKTQLEHILLRPDTYVGSIEAQSQELWVFDSVQSRMVYRKISYVPALYKIFDEILVNAADNLMRDTHGMDCIKVDIDQKSGTISVCNNGKGLPIVIHKEHKVYVPELVFGHLLTSDNYNDSDLKVVGGRNGYGAKLANVFSQEFIIETADGKQKYTQQFLNNMSTKKEPKIVNSKESSYTKVTFRPDFAKLGMQRLDDDTVSLITKRVYDVAGSTLEKCHVYLNGEKLDVNTFRQYTDLYLLTRQGCPQIFEKCSDRWEVCVSVTESGFSQVSFVNSICTIRGGTHVNHVADQLVETILEKAKAESKQKVKGGIDIRPHHVKNHLWIFVKCLIENPAFDSQTKETLTTKQSKFGSRCEISEKFLAEVANSGIVEMIIQAAMAKSKIDLGKKLKANTGRVTRLTGVPKLEDANDAGGKNSAECSLILTEGDSAKAFAVAGLSVVGRDKYGVFPLRGKVLNVRDATLHQMMANTEIQNLIKILGLDFQRGDSYDAELKGLRYGSIMLMTDQDHDGSHIKGLIMNLIHAWFPSLAKLPGFLKEFYTPIVKASRGKTCHTFYSMPEYEKWKQETEGGKGFRIKYYKGLGTSTSKEAKEYFSKITDHTMRYTYEDEADDTSIDLAFNKKRADDRKEWINNYQEGDLVDHSQPEIRYRDFINKELVQFSRANVIRAIPSLMDGFKPSQRKVLFGCFRRKLRNDVKVAQLVGYVSEHAAYHHGEAALSDTIIGMAQDFVGANNVNLLIPAGQFGTRLQGGKDAASARYIYTRLAPVTRMIFPEADDNVLQFLDEEGMSIEPTWYCPVLPMVLVNGCDGIGTGYATSVPNFNPREIIDNCKRYIKGKPLVDMAPWYAGFKGSIEASTREPQKYDVTGCFERKGSNVEVTELPIKKWTQNYREFLEESLAKEGKKKDGGKILEEFTEHHTEKHAHFSLTLSEDGIKQADHLESALKLRSSLATSNMMLFNSEGKIQKYETAEEIIRDFSKTRLIMYEKRKAFLVGRLTRECEILSAKARFIQMVVKGELVVKRRKIKDLINELRQRSFKPLHEMKGHGVEPKEADDEEAQGDEEEGEDGAEDEAETGGDADAQKNEKNALRKGIKDFEYLVGMPISSLTAEKIAELMKQHDSKTAELQALKKITVQTLWLEDLDALELALAERDKKIAEEERIEREKLDKSKAKQAIKGGAGRGTKRSASEAAAAAPASSTISRKRTAAVDEAEDTAGARKGRLRKA
jgi:DNA topoisomerase-2